MYANPTFLHVAMVVALLIGAADAKQVQLEVSLADPVMLADQKQTTFLKIGLTGFELPNSEARAPINIALVIDKSGSMSGQKIAKAKEAAIAAIDRLRSDDIVSLVVYDQGVRVLLPATKLTDKSLVQQRIREITSGGSTALFAGVSKGAHEVRKFLDDNRVNRVLLLSDGKANVGPDSPSALGELGASLLKEKISVTTMGLGLDYQEDLMTQLAMKSNGNHVFIEDADALVTIFQEEFNDVLSVVAQEIAVRIKLREGIRPIRVLGNDAEIHGQDVTVMLNQLYADQEKFILLEVEVPATADGETRPIGDVSVSYANMQTKTTDQLASSVEVRFSSDSLACQQRRNKAVLEKSVLLIANGQNRLATKLRDEGRVAEAREILMTNGDFLDTNARRLNSNLLKLRSRENLDQSRFLSEKDWKKTRKLMVERQYAESVQQRGYEGYGGGYGSTKKQITPAPKANQ
jgi:Ca-activated chloride channel family protein